MTRRWWWTAAIAFGLASTVIAILRRRSEAAPRIRWSLPENAEPDAPERRPRSDW
jgi:hypothetical protein